MPRPIVPPMRIHHRGSSVLSNRTTKYAIRTHHSMSNETYWIIAPWMSDIGATAAATAASMMVRRNPPISRAIRPVSTTIAACAMLGINRTPTSDGPKSSSPMRANSGVNGGYGTYPQSRWRASSST